jgi:hypothetical protein
MHALPAICVVVPLRRRGVKSMRTYGAKALPPAVIEEGSLNGDRALDRGVGNREGHEETVAGVIHFLAPVSGEEGAERLIVPPNEIRPRLVANSLDQLGRPYDVGKHERAGLRPRRLRLGRVGWRRASLRLHRAGDVENPAQTLESGPGCTSPRS